MGGLFINESLDWSNLSNTGLKDLRLNAANINDQYLNMSIIKIHSGLLGRFYLTTDIFNKVILLLENLSVEVYINKDVTKAFDYDKAQRSY